MSEVQNIGVNEPVLAEPADDKGVNEPGVAEPDVVEGGEPHKNTPHEAWAEMRKAREEANKRADEAERKLAEMQAAQTAREEALKRITGNENAEINALAENMGLDPEDILATLNAEQESVRKDLEIKRLKEQIDTINADAAMKEDLAKVQKIDPNVKDLGDLGEPFVNYIKAGLSAEDAYYAVKAKEINNRMVPPPEIGKVDNQPPEKDFFTREEVAAMSEEEQRRNYEKIINSTAKW